MKEIVSILGIFPKDIGEQAFSELLGIYSEGKKYRAFNCTLPTEDPRLHTIRELLTTSGLRPWMDRFRKRPPDEYTIEIERIYEPEELNSAEYLELVPYAFTEGLSRDDHGRIKIDGRELQPSAAFASTKLPWVIVPDRVKRLLQESDLHHIAFWPTIMVGGFLAKDRKEPISWEVYGEPWWELTSELILPPLSPSVDLRDADGQPLSRGSNNFSNGCHLREGLYSHPELHYRKQDLQAVEPFDAALTYEPFGTKGVPLDWRRLVVSRRFRDFCLEHGWKADWVPVRIDED